MGLSWPWSKTYKVRCPDGSERTVYRDINEACPLMISGWKADVSGDISGLSEVTAKGSGKFETQIHGLLYSLNEQNQSLMMSFRTVYLAFQTNPCGNDGFLLREIQKLLDEQRKITALKIQINALVQMVLANPGDSAQITKIFGEIANRIGGAAIAPAASLAIAESRSIAQDAIEEEVK